MASRAALLVGGRSAVLARLLLWRLLGLVAVPLGLALAGWFVSGGPGAALRGGRRAASEPALWRVLRAAVTRAARAAWDGLPLAGVPALRLVLAVAATLAGASMAARVRARRRRRYVRLRVGVYRTDAATVDDLVAVLESLHKRLLVRWWRRLGAGQPSAALEVHVARGPGGPVAWLGVSCPAGLEAMVEAALRNAYPNARLLGAGVRVERPPCLVRLKKRHEFIKRVKVLDRLEHESPPMDRLLTAMAATGGGALVQLALTPTPAGFDRWAKRMYKRHERHLAKEREAGPRALGDRSQVELTELRGALDVQHRPLFFCDLRVIAADRRDCERIASELRAEGAENRLIERGTAVRHGLLGLYTRRVRRGEGGWLAPWHKGVLASTELATFWHFPSVGYATVPFARLAVPVAPAPPAIARPRDGGGLLRDVLGPVSIHPELRRQNVAVPGAVEQGKSSFLVSSVAEDLCRERCAVIVLDPKGDAAEAAVSLVPEQRTCTLLDFAHPTCGFNPLAVPAPADVIADYVVAALRNLFSDADIRASSDRYLRNAIIAVLAADPGASLWDAARLLSVGEEGYAFRARVAARVRGLPELKEISEFFAAELTAQLADARSVTTAKLDAPVNKLARLLNSASIKRVLLNQSLAVDLDRVIAEGEVLVVKGALGAMGAGNTSVLMQLIVGMLDAALARQQDLVAPADRVAVALKVDEAPLVLNRGFAETMALKRSAGLETVACWQTDAQWTDREVRSQLDALFAHRVYFATASVPDARDAASLMMAQFSDIVRSGDPALSTLGRPDVRLHLPKHFAIASWTTPQGRQQPFVGQTIPLRVDPARLAHHARRQAQRGGRYLDDLRQPHWDAGGGGKEKKGEVAAAPPPEATLPGADAGAAPAGADAPPSTVRPAAGPAAETYRELVAMDGARSVRRVAPGEGGGGAPDGVDLEILLFLARMGHALSTQLHRRFCPGRAASTTQRRLKRLAEAGWVERFQFHRPDGGGVPMCYLVAGPGRALLIRRGRLESAPEEAQRRRPGARDEAAAAVARARREVHVTAWVLALEAALGTERPCLARGGATSALSPPAHDASQGRGALGPADLRLPGGRVAHDFQRTGPDGARGPVDRFDTVRPDATVEIGGRLDLLVEHDDRLASVGGAAKLERYDHLVSGWAEHLPRYGRRLGRPPVVAFVCRDAARARECARVADPVLTACQAYAGDYPVDWRYPGRAGIVFAAERDVHEGRLVAYGVPALPPELRVAHAGGDPAARACDPDLVQLPLDGAVAHTDS
jgi:hypothetical protein